ncbi:MAG: hypothetical protein ACRDP3_13625 [Streptomyces sp.]|uniref:hypothetical protein n=1 Tax=Streptomyces sp. TaxID=1931 RepID=UPI003D6B748F
MAHPQNPDGWGTPPQPPHGHKKESFVKRHPVATVFIALAVVLGAVIIGSAVLVSSDGDGGGGQERKSPKPQEPSKEKTETPSTPPPGNERKDLTSFTLDDRSQAGFDDFWLTYEVTNKSSEKSDYLIEYDVVDTRTGKRVFNSELIEDSVKPGQTAKGEEPVLVEEGTPFRNLKVEVTDFNRTASF